jgi:hypothetical protein
VFDRSAKRARRAACVDASDALRCCVWCNTKCGYIVATRTGGVKHGADAVQDQRMSMNLKVKRPARPVRAKRMPKGRAKARQPTSDALMSFAVRATCSATIA